jgi:putative ABC transport system permease protein
MRWTESIGIGVRGLLLRRLRTLLSTLGIVFGVAAVISMVAIGEGARREAVEQIELLGTNNIRVQRLVLTGEQKEKADQRFSAGLTLDDEAAIRNQVPGLAGVAPLRLLEEEVRYEGRAGNAQVVGTNSQYQYVTNFRVDRGRFVTDIDVADTKSICVLGSEVAEDLFGFQDPIGAEIRVERQSFRVVGVMEGKVVREGRGAAIKVRNINRDIYVPITTALRRFSSENGPLAIEEIAIRVERSRDISPTAQRLGAILEQRHRGAEDYEVMVPEELLAQTRRTQRLFNVVMGSIAGISLLVGGIGIMNIMLANVSERTREIGIRRAIGATQVHVMTQFLVETVLVCLVGGFLGIVVGLVLAKGITVFAGWQTGFSPVSVVLAFGTAGTIGVLFGMVPARRAAKLDPVTAIRFE